MTISKMAETNGLHETKTMKIQEKSSKDEKTTILQIDTKVKELLGITIYPGLPDQQVFNSDDLMIVTAIFDLSGRQPNFHRSIHEYMRLGEHVLNLPQNMFIIADPHLVPKIWEYRRAIGLSSKTYIHAMKLEESPYYSYVDKIRKAYNSGKRPVPTQDVLKDRMKPNYVIIGWNRFHCISEALRLNPFGAKGIIWIDYGIFYLYPDDKKWRAFRRLEKSIQHYRVDKITLLSFQHTSKEEIKDLRKYYSEVRNKTASGMIGGPNSMMKWLCEQFKENCQKAMEIGYPPLDEMILNVSCVEHAEKFNFYYGDYKGVCVNHPYNDPKSDFARPMDNFVHCRDKMWENTVKMANYFISSVIHDEKSVSYRDQVLVLDELILAAWWKYKAKGGMDLAKLCAKEIVSILRKHPEVLTPYIIKRCDHNLSFLGYRVIKENGKTVIKEK